MSDEGLRAAYERALATRTSGERAACPAPEEVLAVVRRAGDEDQRLAVLDHVMACPACRDEFELLRAIERAGEKAERAAAAPGRVVGHIVWRRWVPLAAAALVLIIAVGPGRRLWEPAQEQVRGGSATLALVGPADGNTPAGADQTFVWRSAPDAARYTLELLTSGGNVVLSHTTTDTILTVALPPTLAPGDYRWWVTATTVAGSETRSDTRTLRLRHP